MLYKVALVSNQNHKQIGWLQIVIILVTKQHKNMNQRSFHHAILRDVTLTAILCGTPSLQGATP